MSDDGDDDDVGSGSGSGSGSGAKVTVTPSLTLSLPPPPQRGPLRMRAMTFRDLLVASSANTFTFESLHRLSLTGTAGTAGPAFIPNPKITDGYVIVHGRNGCIKPPPIIPTTSTNTQRVTAAPLNKNTRMVTSTLGAICHECGQAGHVFSNCPTLWCTVCNDTGHTNANCVRASAAVELQISGRSGYGGGRAPYGKYAGGAGGAGGAGTGFRKTSQHTQSSDSDNWRTPRRRRSNSTTWRQDQAVALDDPSPKWRRGVILG